MENHANQHHKNQFIISCFTLLLLCSFWQSANAQWSNIGPGSSGYVTTLVIDPVTPTTLYTGVSNGGIFKSTDSGANWVHSSTGLTDGLNDLFIQIIINDHRDFQVQALTIDPTTPSTLYAGIAYAGISKSTDGGTSWSTINTGLLTGNSIDVRTIAINPSTSSTLYAGTGGEGVFKSMDGGSNWNTVNTGINDLNINTLAIDSSNPNILYAGTNNGIFKSTDSGTNWNSSSTGLSDPGARTIIIDPSTPSILYTATASGIFKSIDAGANWSARNTGLSTLGVITLVIDSNNPSTLYAGTNNGLFKSSNGGTSWNISSTGLPPSLHGDWVQTLAIDPIIPSTVYAGTYDSGIFKSINSGTNWSISSAGLVNFDIHALAIDPVSPSIIYAGAYGDGIFKSTDGGANWSNSSTGLSPSFYGMDVQTLAIDPASPSTLYAGTYGGIYKSADSGANWSQITSSLLISDILDVRSIVIDPITPSTLYAVTKDTGNYLIKSIDGGGSWTSVNTGLNIPIYTLAIDPTTPSTLYAGAYGYAGTTINGVLRSTDGGISWSGRMYIAELFLFNDLEVHSLVVDPITPSTLYADNGVGIYKSTNSGASWGISNSGLAFSGWWYDMTIDPSTPSTIYASNRLSGGIFKSTNSGVSWTSINNGLNNLNVTSLAINPATHALYAGTHANSVYKYNLDIIPDGLIFADSSNVPLNALTTSETLTITGIEVDVDIIITGGEYSLNSGTFTAAAGTATNGDTLQLRTTSSASFNTTTNIIVTIGGGSDTWSVTTMIDTIPDAFSFADQINVVLNTLTTSNAVVISGLGASSPISITGGEYSINGAAYTASSGFINDGNSVTVSTISSGSWITPVDAVLTIGGVSDIFTITTEADTDGDGIGNTLDINDDNDGYDDAVDNCILTANDQLDTDGDGYGNACDSDFNNDGIVNSLDIGPFKTDFFKTGSQQTDINGDSIVNSLDLGLFKKQFGASPGPSGTTP